MNGRTGRPLPPPKPIDTDQAAKLAAAAQRAAAARAAKRTGTSPSPAGRAKPARASKVGALALSVATTAGLTAMFAGQDSGTTDSVVLTGGTLATVAPTASTAATAATASTEAAVATTIGDTITSAEPTTTAAAAPAASAILDGTYVGAADSNRWGVVQVQAVYSGGQLVDVQILQYPDGDNKSVRINQRSLPTLIAEAIANQSADVNTVSGATYTSDSYVASLQSAIDAAKAASGITG